MTDLAILLGCAIITGIALTWVNLKAGVDWLKLLTALGFTASFALAGYTLFKMAQETL